MRNLPRESKGFFHRNPTALQAVRERIAFHQLQNKEPRPGEFFEAVSGEVMQQDGGTVRIRGKDAGRLNITGRRLLGAAFVPEERLGHGAAPRMKLSENLFLSRYATDGKAFLGAGGIVKMVTAGELDDFELVGYESHPSIKAPIAV